MSALVGFLFLLWLCYKAAAYILAAGSFIVWRRRGASDERVLEPTDSREINNIITDALAAYSPGLSYLAGAALAAALPLAVLPLVHYIYVVWMNFFTTFDSTMVNHPIRAALYDAALSRISGYLPSVAANIAVLLACGMFFAFMRRRILRRSPYRKLLFWKVSATECFGVVLCWIGYVVVAMAPRVDSEGTYNLSGLLTASGGWLWITSGFLLSWYIHAAHNAILWSMFRYRWAAAIPGIVKMMAMHRLELPAHGLPHISADHATGTVEVQARIDELNAPRLRDDLLAIPGLRHPVVVALGPLPGMPVNLSKLPPRMKPLPPRAFRRPQGPPAGYNAEYGPSYNPSGETGDRDGDGR